MRTVLAVVQIHIPERADRSNIYTPVTDAGIAIFIEGVQKSLNDWVDTQVSDDGPAYYVQVMEGIREPGSTAHPW